MVKHGERPVTLQAVADFLSEVNDDILPDQYLETDWTKASDQDCMALFCRVYLHGSCAEFAYALHCKYSWPTCRISDHDAVHYVCQRPDGKFVDYSGAVTVDEICKRYRFTNNMTVIEVFPDECSFDSDDHEWSEQSIARFVLETSWRTT